MRPSKHKGKGGGGGAATDTGRGGISSHVNTLRQRLHHALNLGTRYYEDNEFKWKCTDVEIQRHVVRSISAFLDSVSGDTFHHPLVRESVPDIVRALVWILHCRSEAVAGVAANVVVKLINILPSPSFQHYMLDFVLPLMLLLSSHELEVAISCSTALNIILSSLNVKKESQVWYMLKEAKSVASIITNLRNFSAETMPIAYFREMASLLSVILRRWPPSRYPVWNDTALMKVLEAHQANPVLSVKVAVLKVYSSLALCGNGTRKLMENGETLLQIMIQCMHSSHALSVQIEGFKLAQCLAIDETGFLRMTSLCCKPLVKAMVCGMNRRSFHSVKVSNDQMSLLVAACRLALVTRWRGEHHNYFWKYGIDKILLDLLMEDPHNQASKSLSLDECISMAQEGLNANFLLTLRPFVWDILGWLSTHCSEKFSPQMHGNSRHIDILISCACIAFVDSIRKGSQICQNDIVHTSRSESASRAVLLMIYSPCKYVASKSRFLLSEVLNANGKEYGRHMLHTLNYTSSGHNIGLPNIIQTIISLVGLTCYLGLSQYRRHVIKGEVMSTILSFVKWCLSSRIRIKRQSFAPHLVNKLLEKTCCMVRVEEWEGEDVLLLYGLWALAELVHHDDFVRDNQDTVSDDVYKEPHLVSILQDICFDTFAHGPRWFAAYILSRFGFYGFPCKLGKRIGKALHVQEHADMQLILANGETLTLHSVILAIRCPSLLPLNEKASYNSSSCTDAEKLCGKCQSEVRLSAHVDAEALRKLLQFIYSGYLEAREELLKKLKPLAKSCDLRPLLLMLYRKRPKWGTPYQSCDLALALGPPGLHFSDVILEAKEPEQLHWTCNICSVSIPHKHVHKIILWSSCDYLRALFRSGMQESSSQRIKVPVSWQATAKLVEWFYTDQLPNPPYGCLWDNMDTEQKLEELQPYLELCWLAELWLLEDFGETCFRVIISCLDTDRQLSIKIIQIAAEYSLWKLTEVAADYMAPLHNKLRDSGDLEEMDEFLVDMVRAASVRLSQEGNNHPRHVG